MQNKNENKKSKSKKITKSTTDIFAIKKIKNDKKAMRFKEAFANSKTGKSASSTRVHRNAISHAGNSLHTQSALYSTNLSHTANARKQARAEQIQIPQVEEISSSIVKQIKRKSIVRGLQLQDIPAPKQNLIARRDAISDNLKIQNKRKKLDTTKKKQVESVDIDRDSLGKDSDKGRDGLESINNVNAEKIQVNYKGKQVKKVIYAEIDDEITTIINSLKKIKASNVYIVVPRNANLFRSVINLKILKRKSKELKKNISFITDDKNGVYLAKKIGITVYNQANPSGNLTLFSVNDSDGEKLKPLKASVNAVEQDNGPIRITEKKISISQIVNKKNHRKAGVRVTSVKQSGKPKKKKKTSVNMPNRHLIIGLLISTFFIVLIVIYIALPGATIYITPTANVIEKSMNITLADYKRNRIAIESAGSKIIPTYPIEMNLEKTIVYNATGKKLSEKGKNATGKIKIINRSNIDWGLVSETRFQTDNGLVYRIKEPVMVPSAHDGKWGELEVFVVADPVDVFGVPIGERGNIDKTTFIVPGLSEENQKKLSAESVTVMTGGVTDFVTYVSDEDVDAARKKIKDMLLKEVKLTLKDAVDDKGKVAFGADDSYVLLDGDDAIIVDDVDVVLQDDIVGEYIDSFKVFGTLHVEGVYYERESMLEILRSELLVNKGRTKELLRINDDSISYRVFEVDRVAGKIRITANIKGIEQFNIDVDTEDGRALLDKIREHVVGMRNENAKSFIQNLPEVNHVEIDNWPVWAPTLPKFEDNIEFEIRDAVYSN